MTHICVIKLIIIGSDNGLSPGRRQAIIWTNAGILSIGLLGTKFSAILIEIRIFSFKKMRLKVSSEKWRPFWLGLNVLMHIRCVYTVTHIPWWCQDMEMLSVLVIICEGIHRSPTDSSHKMVVWILPTNDKKCAALVFLLLFCYLTEDAEEKNEPPAISGTVEIMWHSCNDYPEALD